LDSIQTVNLPNINDFITAPEVNLILSIQDYQEAIHSQSYTTILETAVPALIDLHFLIHLQIYEK